MVELCLNNCMVFIPHAQVLSTGSADGISARALILDAVAFTLHATCKGLNAFLIYDY